MTEILKVNEIFGSLIGESTYAGLPGTIVRLTGCNLRCSYCDTKYAYENGIEMSVSQVLRTVSKYDFDNVLITGGEPLLQENCVGLINQLLDQDYIVLVETNGSMDIRKVPDDAIIILDVKCPGSGAHESIFMNNIDYLRDDDNVKFVLTNREDYDWACEVMYSYELDMTNEVLMSPVHGVLDPRDLWKWITEDQLNARLHLQLHKIVWGGDATGR